MKEITAGIVAHVDAGKTTLSEALLYEAGNLRKLGRVDNGNAFLDPDELEKKRGITIYSHEAQLQLPDFKLTLLDTPGHIDFAAQTEQVMSVLDYAILVISATDGITSYTRTLWNLLRHYEIPCFIFINKMDALGVDKEKIIADVQKNLDDSCFDFSKSDADFYENIATVNEKLFDQYLNEGKIADEQIKKLIAEAYQNEKIVLIENEFGEIGIDGTFLKDSGVTINEMNSGCICCSLVGDFETSLKEVLDTYHPDRVIIEPSGVGKLSDVIKAVSTINSDEMELDNFITVVDELINCSPISFNIPIGSQYSIFCLLSIILVIAAYIGLIGLHTAVSKIIQLPVIRMSKSRAHIHCFH